MIDLSIRNDEQVVFALRSLYERFGYTPYKMTKFEEYDLYVKNKDFLISDNIITFTDTNGKLMALKPDVTLSIIKSNDDSVNLRKVYYNENVYRVSKGSDSFKEIMQVGLECIGDVDNYCIYEVLSLAAESLKTIYDKCVLSVSDLDILFEVLEEEKLSSDVIRKIMELIGQKNLHELTSLCKKSEVSEKTTAVLSELAVLHGAPDYAISKLKKILPDSKKVDNFGQIINSLSDEVKSIVEIDFSTVGDFRYYNGIAFKGFVYGIFDSVISGGQYDKLMSRMKQKSKAIGFAIYTDLLERLNENVKEYDVDTVLVYDASADLKKLNRAIQGLSYNGVSVVAVKDIPEKLKYRVLMKFDGEEARLYETNA